MSDNNVYYIYSFNNRKCLMNISSKIYNIIVECVVVLFNLSLFSYINISYILTIYFCSLLFYLYFYFSSPPLIYFYFFLVFLKISFFICFIWFDFCKILFFIILSRGVDEESSMSKKLIFVKSTTSNNFFNHLSMKKMKKYLSLKNRKTSFRKWIIFFWFLNFIFERKHSNINLLIESTNNTKTFIMTKVCFCLNKNYFFLFYEGGWVSK